MVDGVLSSILCYGVIALHPILSSSRSAQDDMVMMMAMMMQIRSTHEAYLIKQYVCVCDANG